MSEEEKAFSYGCATSGAHFGFVLLFTLVVFFKVLNVRSCGKIGDFAVCLSLSPHFWGGGEMKIAYLILVGN